MPGVNAAQRVVDCLVITSQINSNVSMLDGLKILFNYTPTEPFREHSQKLELLLSQIDFVENNLKSLDFPEHLSFQQISSARNAFSTSALNNSWSHVKNHITPDVELAFKWAAYALADEANQIDDATLASLREEINSLKSDPLLAKMPPTLRDLITKYLNAILEAIVAYPLAGRAPFQKAAEDFAVKIIVENDALVAETTHVSKEAESFYKTAKNVIKKTFDVVSTTSKGVEAIDKIWKIAADRAPILIDFVNKIQ